MLAHRQKVPDGSGTARDLDYSTKRWTALTRYLDDGAVCSVNYLVRSKKHECMQNPASANHRNGSGRQVSFTVENKRAPNYIDWMKHRVDSQQGKVIYGHRMSVVEPVFGNIGSNKRLNRFSLRTKKKVQGQWQLYCLVHNIETLANYGQLAA